MADKTKKAKVVAGFQFQPVQSKAGSIAGSSQSGSTSTGKRGRAETEAVAAAAAASKRPSLLEGLPSYPAIDPVSRPPASTDHAARLGVYVESVLTAHVGGVTHTYAQFASVGKHISEIVASFVDGPLRDSLRAEAAGHAARDAITGYRNVKNIENAAAAVTLQAELARALEEAAQWRAGAQRASAAQAAAEVHDDAVADDALISRHSGTLDALAATLSTALPATLMHVDAVARALRASGKVVDDAHALTRRAAAAVRSRAFADYVPTSTSAGDARAVIRGALKAGLAPASAADALASIVGADAYDAIHRLADDADGGRSVPHVKSPDAARSAAAALSPMPTPSTASRRGRGRGRGRATVRMVEEDDFEDAQGGGAGRPSVPEITPNIVKRIRRGRAEQQ